MSLVHVNPDKLPCDTGGSFMVVLSESLPSAEDVFSLTFKGITTKKKISGKAVQVDTKTLMCIVGGFGDPEEVKVDVVSASGAMRIRSFKVSFVTRFQLICGQLPDSTPLQAVVVLARYLQGSGKSREAMDDEISKVCQRWMPEDLSQAQFLLGDTLERQPTLLHFAVESGLPKFLAHMLVASPGAWKALYTTNGDCLTPRHVADKLNHIELKTLFDDYERMAVSRPEALREYVSTEEQAHIISGILADVMTKWKPTESPRPTARRKKMFPSIPFIRKRTKQKTDSKIHKGRPTPTPSQQQGTAGTSLYSEPNEAVQHQFLGTYELLGAHQRQATLPKNFGRPLPAPPTGCPVSDSEEEEDDDDNEEEEDEDDSEAETEHTVEVRGSDYSKAKMADEKRRNSGPKQLVIQEHSRMKITDADIPDLDDDDEGSDEATGEAPDWFVIDHTWQPNKPSGMILKRGDLVTIVGQCQNRMWKVRSQQGEECIIPGVYLKHQQSVKMAKTKSDPSRHSGSFPYGFDPKPEVTPRESLYTLPGKEADKPQPDESHTSGSHTSGSSVDSGVGGIQNHPNMSNFDTQTHNVETMVKKAEIGIYDEIKDRPRSTVHLPNERLSSTCSSPDTTISHSPSPIKKSRKFGFTTKSVPHPNEEKAASSGELQTDTAPTRPNPPIPRKPLGKYTCIWDYEAHGSSDLPLKKGDEVIVVEKHNEDWWTGKCRGRKGMFPAQNVAKKVDW